jgi:hypothetical protein
MVEIVSTGKQLAAGPHPAHSVRYLVVALLLIASCPSTLRAQLQDERTVRAAYVFNLTKYVDWPTSDREFTIGVVGEGSMGETLKKLLEGRKTGDRLIRVVLSPNEVELESCSMLYFAQSASKRIQPAIEIVRNRSVLTIGETESFVSDGGIVALVRTGGEVQIQVNLDAAQSANLSISSQLLNLSKIVRKAGARN